MAVDIPAANIAMNIASLYPNLSPKAPEVTKRIKRTCIGNAVRMIKLTHD